MDRRTLLSMAAGSVLGMPFVAGATRSGKLALYANVGYEMLHFDVNLASAALTQHSVYTIPGDPRIEPTAPLADPLGVQYAWPHASHRALYVTCSDWDMKHTLTALRIDPETGDLSQHGEQIRLPARPINVCTDVPSENVLVAFNKPSGVRVFRIEKDLTIGQELPEPGVTDGGIFAHQIRVTPDNLHAILVTRGNNATATKPEAPGALKMFDYDRGTLTNESSIAPDGGKGFGPRHLDFHPTKPWVYVSLERQSKLYMYRLENGRLADDFSYRKETVAEPGNMRPRQLAGAIHVHRNGRFVYVANRADGRVDFKGQKVFGGGENNIAVYSIDQETGEPTAIQHVDTHKVYPRTFSIDPTGTLMVVQHTLPFNFRDGDDVRVVPAGLSVFRIGGDGKLSFVRVHDVDVGNDGMFWMGIVPL